MNTDSPIYNIQTEDFYADIADDMLERFNTSGYVDGRPLPTGKNKKVIGYMKDELGGKIMTEFVALRLKSYAYKFNSKEEKKCKGMKKCIVKKMLRFDDYVNCLFSSTNDYRSQLMFRSTKHEIHMIKVDKVALNRDDDKRIVKKDGIRTFTRGHKSLCWNSRLGEVSLI